MVWVAFALIVTLWVVATLVLTFHWKTYGVNPLRMAVMKYIYLIGSSFFLIIIFLSALTYSIS